MGVRQSLFYDIQELTGKSINCADDVRALDIPEELKVRAGTVEQLEKIIEFLKQQNGHRNASH
jgi:hypothetical protein